MADPLLAIFDSIQIVSLVERTDRRSESKRELAQFDLVPGQGAVEFFDAIRPTEDGGFPNIGARGCYLSHLEILRTARQQGIERLLVLEDDVLFMPEMKNSSVLLDLCNRQDWDFLYLGHMMPPEPGNLRWVVTPPHQGLLCTHGYAVHRRVIPSLITYLEQCLERPLGDPLGGPMPVDGAFSMFREAHPEVVTYRSSTPLIEQRSSQSDIAGPHPLEAHLPTWLVRLLRTVKNRFRRSQSL